MFQATLWLEWRHQGKLTALAVSDLYLMEPAQFAGIMRSHPKPWFFAGSYAVQFLKFVQNLEPTCFSDFVRDEFFPKLVIEGIMSCSIVRQPEGASILGKRLT